MTSAKPVANALVTSLLRQRVAALFEQLPGAVAGNEEAIHDLRIAGRRLRTALPVLALQAGGKRQVRCGKALRALTRASGAARDLDVTAGLLNGYLAVDASRRPKSSLMRRHMQNARRRSHARLAQILLDADIRCLRSDTAALLERGGADQATALSRCARRVRARHRRLLAGLAALGNARDVVALHAVRRTVRRLRYLLELRGELGGGAADATRLLKGLQDALGHIHDQHVLATWLQGHSRRARTRAAFDQAHESTRLRVHVEQVLAHWHRRWLNSRPLDIVSKVMAMSSIVDSKPSTAVEGRRGR
jgi:CHAD domain-containing protein